MLNVRIGGTLESTKDRPELVACHNNIIIEGNCNQYEIKAVAEIIATGLTELLPYLIELGGDGMADFMQTMNKPLMKWALSHETKK